jgi:Flp pilus assembly protein TadG
MTPHRQIRRSFWQDEEGSTLVEFSIVISLFLLILFGLVDFGRLAYHLVTSERAMQAAARLAAVRPAACAGVPATLVRAALAPDNTAYGTSCNAGGPVCADPGPVTCAGSSANATAVEIWNLVQPTLPPGATIANLRFSYAFDPNLGFLGGPYVPVVTVELDDVGFDFVTPLTSLAQVAGATPGGGSWDAGLVLPAQSVSIPGEDLAQGEGG